MGPCVGPDASLVQRTAVAPAVGGKTEVLFMGVLVR